MRHTSATAHELARIAELAGVPGETLARLGERMTRVEVAPGSSVGGDETFSVVIHGMLRGPSGMLRPGDSFDGVATAVTPATIASCPRSEYDALTGR